MSARRGMVDSPESSSRSGNEEFLPTKISDGITTSGTKLRDAGMEPVTSTVSR